MKFIDKIWKNKNYRFFVQKDKDSLWIHYEGETYLWKEEKASIKKIKTDQSVKQSLIKANLPGRIQKVFVKKLESVKKGQNLLTLSAMKIEYSFKAEGEGKVEEIFFKEGDTVNKDQNLIKIKYT
ncbi:MAG: acetyl-CoA carboxylase biotin carboxyl carrier protein subunit [Bdellovibrionaceae bacterium]|nr:acetyl-CoA carboxylase biotin carboxyl carrier protein subunit [Pseudobdellovibrionaceae bacterium]